MRIFITGHTSGIGKAIYELAKEKGYTVTGGSKSTGFDISNPDVYSQVLEYDVLVNNAYHYTGQLELLKYAHKNWTNTSKKVINVGTWHKDVLKGRPLSRLNYNVAKKSLETYSFWISDNETLFKSMMYNPGYVDTLLARQGIDEWPVADQQRVLAQLMDPKECAKTIMFMIESKHKFKEITHTY